MENIKPIIQDADAVIVGAGLSLFRRHAPPLLFFLREYIWHQDLIFSRI